jgi:hypothetical protein
VELASTGLTRFYLSVWALVLGVGAVTLSIVAAMFAIALVLDALRLMTRPEFSSQRSAIARDYEQLSAHPHALSRFRRTNVRLFIVAFGMTWAHLASFVACDVTIGLSDSFLHLMQPLQDVAASGFLLVRRHDAGLSAAGYPYRAALVSHFYAIQFLFFLMFLVVSAFWLGPRLSISARARQLTGEVVVSSGLPARRRLLRVGLGVAAISFVSMLGLEILPTLALPGEGRHGWNLATSDGPLFMFCLFVSGVEVMALGAYAALHNWFVFHLGRDASQRGGESL